MTGQTLPRSLSKIQMTPSFLWQHSLEAQIIWRPGNVPAATGIGKERSVIEWERVWGVNSLSASKPDRQQNGLETLCDTIGIYGQYIGLYGQWQYTLGMLYGCSPAILTLPLCMSWSIILGISDKSSSLSCLVIATLESRFPQHGYSFVLQCICWRWWKSRRSNQSTWCVSLLIKYVRVHRSPCYDFCNALTCKFCVVEWRFRVMPADIDCNRWNTNNIWICYHTCLPRRL